MLSLSAFLFAVNIVSGNAEKDFYRSKLNEAKENMKQVKNALWEALKESLVQTAEGKKYKETKDKLFASCHGPIANFDDRCNQLRSDYYDSWVEVEETEYYNSVYRPLLIDGAYQTSLIERLTKIVNAVEDNKNDDPVINKIICIDTHYRKYFVPNFYSTPEVIKAKDSWIGEDRATDKLHSMVKEAKACILREEQDIKNAQQEKIKKKMKKKKGFLSKRNALYEATENRRNAESAEQRAMQRLLKTEQGCAYKERNDILYQNCSGNPNNWDDRCKTLYSYKNDSLEKLKRTEEYTIDYRPFVVDLACQQTFENGLMQIPDALMITDGHASQIIKRTTDDENESIFGLITCGEIPERMEIEDLKIGRDKGNEALRIFAEKIIAFKNALMSVASASFLK